MRKTIALFSFFLFICSGIFAQANLLSPISTPGLPADSTLISSYTTYIDTSDLFVQSGFHSGDIIPDFTFYDTASQALTMSNLLSDGKPVVLVSISLTCPASRSGMIQVLPDLVTLYGNQVNFVLVYTMEAHPVSPDLCPYSGTVNTTLANYQDSVLYPQTKRYFHRKVMASRFINRYHPAAYVIIDGPGNEFWSNFGPAPNNAYLIAPDGMVYAKYGWFSRSKAQLLVDIPALLNSVGQNELMSKNDFSLYPNPSSDVLFIQHSGTERWSYRIYNASGEQVSASENETSPSASVSVAELPAGIYLVDILTADEHRQLRFVRN